MSRSLLISPTSRRDQPNQLLSIRHGTNHMKILSLNCIKIISTMDHSIPVPQRECVAIFQNKVQLMLSKQLKMVGKFQIWVSMTKLMYLRSTSPAQLLWLTPKKNTFLITSQLEILTKLWWTGCLFHMHALEIQENAQKDLREIHKALLEHTVCTEFLENRMNRILKPHQ